MNKNTLIKIAVPVLIVLVVAGIWAVKNVDVWKPTPASKAGLTESTLETNEDFLLETDRIDLDTLTAYGLPIIFDFGSEDCDPCRRMKPDLIAVNDAMQGKAIVKFLDVWKYPDAATGYPIQLIPTQMFINADGTPYVPGEDIDIEFISYNNRDTGEHALTLHQGMLTEDEMLLILADMGVEK